ncbi:biotin--[acetyl-CoA-carboxylase] ligase [Sphingomonas sp. ASV193]|uniref:biotin--[acetyl-CoA-carboxylase] ligase n=1 Tax=Sphingomonas sp. ASV193 TaxID=3144405 RepID=UPI0032E902BF
MLADLGAVEGDWLVAARQDAGRGRQGRRWETIPGNFLGSTLVRLRERDPGAPSLALAAGLALVEAVDAAVPGRDLSLKWPNDLMLGTAKLAGILLERSGDRVVAGFGVNLAGAPDIAGRATASIGGIVTPQAFAPLLAASFARVLAAWRASDGEAFARAWLQRAHPPGTPLSVHGGEGAVVSGRFDGIEPDGALRLRRDDGGEEIVRVGDVALG